MHCPNCQHKIIADDIDVRLELLQCHYCEQEMALFDLVPPHPILNQSKFELRYQPKGVKILRNSVLSLRGSHYHTGKAILFGGIASIWAIGGGSYFYYADWSQWDIPFIFFGLLFYIVLSIVFIGLTISTIWGYAEVSISATDFSMLDNMRILKRRANHFRSEEINFLEAKVSFDGDGNESCSIVIHTKDTNPFSNSTAYVELSVERCRYIVNAANRVLYYIEQGLPLCLHPDLLANLVSEE